MFRCSGLAMIVTLLGASAWASPHWNVSLGYLSWQETLTLQSGTAKDFGSSNFSGNNLNLSYEGDFGQSPHGWRVDGGFSAGTATAGGNQALLVYQSSNVPWTGENLSVLYRLQLSPTMTLAAGPLALARQISYPTVTNSTTTATSGASVNFGAQGNLRFNLTPTWNVQFLMGALGSNANTLWDFSIGYLF